MQYIFFTFLFFTIIIMIYSFWWNNKYGTAPRDTSNNNDTTLDAADIVMYTAALGDYS